MNARQLLLELYHAALSAADGREAVVTVLRHCGEPRVAVFAIGKAASSMARGAQDSLGNRMSSLFVVTKDGHLDPELRRIAGATLLESAHPIPDERSLLAGAELARHLRELPADVYPVFLVSGGSSSLVESLHEGRELEELKELNRRGLAAGWDIGTLNEQRARLSRLKRGGVARLLGNRESLALFISDVPDDDPGVIGSGLLGEEPGRRDRIDRVVVANISATVRHAALAAQAFGANLEVGERFDGDAADIAERFVDALRSTSADGLVWGGESTVTLPARPGRGGRNQHLALAAARALRANEALTILAAGTDGTDGTTDDAGALIDSGTIERAELAGVDVERAWRDFDSGTALEASEDLVHTGPTGTNVGDILIGIKQTGRRFRDLARPRML